MSEFVGWVPDGDPCPKHPTEKSRLFHLAGVGLISQCEECIEEFFRWRWANMNERAVPLPPALPKDEVMKQLDMLEPAG